MEFTFSSAMPTIDPGEPTLWIATFIAALAFGLSTLFLGRHVWAGASSLLEYLARLSANMILFVGLLIPFAVLHSILTSALYSWHHDQPLGAFFSTLSAPWSRHALVLGGLAGIGLSLWRQQRTVHRHHQPRH